MHKLSIMDLAFLLSETAASPKHVGGLLIFSKPRQAGADFVTGLHKYLLQQKEARAPFNQVLSFSLTGGPCWKTAEAFDIEQHLFLHYLPEPGKREQLYQLVGDLHAEKMPRDRPIWEFHLIDGVADGHFAIYAKQHHAYADGITMSSWLTKALSKSARSRRITPLWQMPSEPEEPVQQLWSLNILTSLLGRSRDRLRMLGGLAKLSAQLLLEQVDLTRNAVAVPFRAEHTPLNGQISAGRQIVSAAIPMARVDHIRKLTRSSLNHVALTCVDAALHRYLRSCGTALREPIVIQMPVSLRRRGERGGGNKIGIVLVELARETSDPYKRLREIGFTLRNVRHQVDGVPPSSVAAYTVILGVFAQLAESLNLSDALPPLGNTLVSNVPGPARPLYLRGARLREMYPVSALPPGNHMNITLYSYAGTLYFGVVATRALPGLARLGEFIDQAFIELENAVLASR